MNYEQEKRLTNISTNVASGVDIKNKSGNLTAPTPQNTPINPAPITSTFRPTIGAISEDTEGIGSHFLLFLFIVVNFNFFTPKY